MSYPQNNGPHDQYGRSGYGQSPGYGQNPPLGYGQNGAYGQNQPTAQPQPGAYGQNPGYGQAGGYAQPVGYAQNPPAGYGGPAAVPQAPQGQWSAGPTPGGPGVPGATPGADYKPSSVSGPIPLTQESLVLRQSATGFALISMIVAGGFGVMCLVGVVWNLADLGGKGTIGATVLLTVLGIIVLFLVGVMMSARTVLDGAGIHHHIIGNKRDFPWPRSRSGLFVRVSRGSGTARYVMNQARACLVTSEGKPAPLIGLQWAGPSLFGLEAKGVQECSRIWDWAVGRGYTREEFEYIPLVGGLGLLQGMREKQEQRFGLVPGR